MALIRTGGGSVNLTGVTGKILIPNSGGGFRSPIVLAKQNATLHNAEVGSGNVLFYDAPTDGNLVTTLSSADYTALGYNVLYAVMSTSSNGMIEVTFN